MNGMCGTNYMPFNLVPVLYIIVREQLSPFQGFLRAASVHRALLYVYAQALSELSRSRICSVVFVLTSFQDRCTEKTETVIGDIVRR